MMDVNKSTVWSEKADSEMCLLCSDWEFRLNEQLGFLSSESIVGRWEYWTVAADLAPLSLGHLLARPKCHRSSFADYSVEERFELEEIINSVNAYATRKGYNLVAYEHCDGHSSTRNCIVHSHLHLLPVPDTKEKNCEIVHLLDDLEQLENTSQLSQQTLRNYILIHYGSSWHYASGMSLTDSIRDRLELTCAGENAPWRTRLQEIEKCRQLIELSVGWYSDF